MTVIRKSYFRIHETSIYLIHCNCSVALQEYNLLKFGGLKSWHFENKKKHVVLYWFYNVNTFIHFIT